MSEEQKPAPTKQKAAAAVNSAPTKPKLKMRGSMTIVHHLFRAGLADFFKNQSWKKLQPNLTKVPHIHFFHTVTSNGKPQQYTTAVGGHFHEVEWNIDPVTGEPVAKCGPPLKKVAVPGIDGLTTHEIREIKWHDGVGSMGQRGKDIIDTHRHEMIYEGSDEFTTEQIRQTQAANRAGVMDGMEAARQTLKAEGISINE